MTRIIVFQNLGFLVILLICYLDDLLKLPATKASVKLMAHANHFPD